jgi:hypothetical protein
LVGEFMTSLFDLPPVESGSPPVLQIHDRERLQVIKVEPLSKSSCSSVGILRFQHHAQDSVWIAHTPGQTVIDAKELIGLFDLDSERQFFIAGRHGTTLADELLRIGGTA